MGVNNALILNNHTCKLSNDDTEKLFSLLMEINDTEGKTHSNACFESKQYCAYKSTMANHNPDMPTYWQASSGDKAKYWFEAMNK
mmetsp:Transcript_27975/g.37185  ORF Transcript_27975/g.37185 Transcript_27975/m.37185 type:complete len:85 (-) Transcript_27975:89-343(-)